MSESVDTLQPRAGWHDDPIRTIAEDRFRRAPVAKRAAQLIAENHNSTSSVVYGLEGPWGSGKTSVITLLASYLTEMDQGRWKIVTFTPWATTGTEGLLSEFFAALATVAPKSNGQKLRSLIAEYSDIARPFVALLPVVGAALNESSKTLEHRLAKPWNKAFDEVASTLQELKTPVLVVVDDIDRLQSSELLDLLKVVRLLGRFPGVDFLLAYDEQTLIDTIHNSGQGKSTKARARSFMEKIVQYPLSIPPLLTSQVIGMLNVGLTEIWPPERMETLSDRRLARALLTTMPRQLTTPRAVERFIAQVREQFRAHDLDEVNGVDLILTTFVRVQFPDVFAKLQLHKADLTRAVSPISNSGYRDESEPDWGPLICDLEQAKDREDALSMLGEIFPAVLSRRAPRAEMKRFAHPDYFDRYLAQAIPEGDIRDAQITQVLDAAAKGHIEGLRTLLADPDKDRVMLGLGRILARYPDANAVDNHTEPEGPITLELLEGAMELLDEARDDSRGAWISVSDQLRYWAAAVLQWLLQADPSSEVDAALLKCSTVYRRAHVITTARNSTNNLTDEAQKALTEALQREIARILPLLLQDLRLRDNSNEEFGASFLYSLVLDSPSIDELRSLIKEGLDKDDFTIEDVAARFVGFGYIVGGSGRPSGASFSGTLFSQITGVDARSVDHHEISSWSDTSWARRRTFALQFIESRRADVDGGQSGGLEN